MTAAEQAPLWGDDWEVEPCADAAADERAFLDLHGPQQRAIPGDHGRSPSRGRRWADFVRPSVTVRVTGGVL